MSPETKKELEYVQGKEQHSSSWGKYYIKGLEEYAAKEDFDENRLDNHHQYQGYVCLDVPINTVFTIFEQSGDKRGTDDFHFSICIVSENEQEDKARFGSGFIKGFYDILAEGHTKTKSPRLMDWWIDNSELQSIEFAKHCGNFINKRGCKILPPMEG